MIVLETDRLILRRLVSSDLDDLAAIYSDPEVRKFFPEGTLTREETKEELEWFIDEQYPKRGWGLWATVHRESGEFIGRCGLLAWTFDGRDEVEVAYMLARSYWGQGLATEAARAIAAYGFGELGLPRLISLIDKDNIASIRVATKVGMTFEREVDDGKGPAQMYSMASPAQQTRSS